MEIDIGIRCLDVSDIRHHLELVHPPSSFLPSAVDLVFLRHPSLLSPYCNQNLRLFEEKKKITFLSLITVVMCVHDVCGGWGEDPTTPTCGGERQPATTWSQFSPSVFIWVLGINSGL